MENNIIYFDTNGNLHNENGPAKIVYDINEKVIREEYYINGKLENGDEASIVEYDEDENISKEEFYENGILKLIIYYEENEIKEWYKNDKLEMTQIIYYDKEDNKIREEWYKNGKLNSRFVKVPFDFQQELEDYEIDLEDEDYTLDFNQNPEAEKKYQIYNSYILKLNLYQGDISELIHFNSIISNLDMKIDPYQNNIIKRLEPAVIVYDKKENVILKEWYSDGKLDRDDGPARISKFLNKSYRIFEYRGDESEDEYEGNYLKEWYKNNSLFNSNGPTKVFYDHLFNVTRAEWCNPVNGKLHRGDGPAVIDKNKEIVEWYFNGKLHNDDNKPAKYYIKTREYYGLEVYFIVEEWYFNEKLHNSNGPALIEYDDNNYSYSRWYFNGKELTEDQVRYLEMDKMWKNEEIDSYIQYLPHEMMDYQKRFLNFNQ